ncbi:MAG: UDP-N-acetylglucosamine 1-carboxyvinyltransferase [Clostridia bacterium]|nr:UDP-N-acetylglucosamine 1-carboxyvinyltransferase [Clostridia bacterium]
MSKLLIDGGKILGGEVKVQGSKNSTLPILAASLLSKGESVFFGCPQLSDVDSSVKILRYLGCKVRRSGHILTVNTEGLSRDDIPEGLMRLMRSSIIYAGALLASTGKARLTFPGGCEIGPRPIDLHLSSLKRLGAEISERHGELIFKAPKGGLRGSKIALSFPSVGATENIIIAATRAKGTTVITNAAREPEITDLADYLNACGACVEGAGEGTVVIEGRDNLTPANHGIIPDRIVAATLMSAAAVTGSDITLGGVIKSHLDAVIPCFEQAGCKVDFEAQKMRIQAPERLKSLGFIRTTPYPGFPTDAQAPMMAVATVGDGISVFSENIFESRYKHIGEFIRLGADIKVEGKVAVVSGVKKLYSAPLCAKDLRGSAALAVAALTAEGTTEIDTTEYLERGYEDLEVVLTSLGASVRKI